MTHYRRAVIVDPGESRLLSQEVLLAAAYPLSTGGSWRTSLYFSVEKSETVTTQSSRKEFFSVIAQFLGATGGVALARYLLRGALGNHAVCYAVTVPGVYGSTVAFVAELAISFFLMITVLFATNHERLAPYTAYFVGILIATYFTFEAPLSGMSTNPGTNIRLSTSRELLARALDLFHRSVDGHAGRRRGISSSPPGRRPILR
jgi:hypothetical protein